MRRRTRSLASCRGTCHGVEPAWVSVETFHFQTQLAWHSVLERHTLAKRAPVGLCDIQHVAKRQRSWRVCKTENWMFRWTWNQFIRILIFAQAEKSKRSSEKLLEISCVPQRRSDKDMERWGVRPLCESNTFFLHLWTIKDSFCLALCWLVWWHLSVTGHLLPINSFPSDDSNRLRLHSGFASFHVRVLLFCWVLWRTWPLKDAPTH